jgi:hypothetical protein
MAKVEMASLAKLLLRKNRKQGYFNGVKPNLTIKEFWIGFIDAGD